MNAWSKNTTAHAGKSPTKLTSGVLEKSLMNRLPFASASIMLLEFGVLMASAFIADWVYHEVVYGHSASTHWSLIGFFAASIFTLLQVTSGKYVTSWILTRSNRQSSMLRDWLITFSVVLILSFLLKNTDVQSRGAYVLFGILGYLSIVLTRTLVFKLLKKAIATTRFVTRRIVLIGNENDIDHYCESEELWKKGIQVAATLVYDSNGASKSPDLWVKNHQILVPLVGIENSLPYLREIEADDIVLTLPWSKMDEIKKVLDQIITLPATIYLAPDPVMDEIRTCFGEYKNLSHALTNPQSGLSGIRIVCPPISLFSRILKRSFDIVFSGLGLLLLSPVFLVIGALIKLESPGPAIYRQQRNGFNERVFSIYKFRSMVVSENSEFSQTQKNDVRITRIGAFIRRTNIDELPQLLNAFLGTMSLVGPRPHAVEHNNEFMDSIAYYAGRHHVKPGITGWAQINGWRGAAEEHEHMQMRVSHDLEYIQNWSFILDLKILFFTVFSRKAFTNAF